MTGRATLGHERADKPVLAHLALVPLVAACATSPSPPDGAGGHQGATADVAPASPSSTGALGSGGAGGARPEPVCQVAPGLLDAAPPCADEPAESDGLELVEKWRYEPPLVSGVATDLLLVPLVANLTDDNGDGTVDLCDVPDVVVVEVHADLASARPLPDRVKLVLLSGADGSILGAIDPGDLALGFPAIADVTGDSTPEVLATNREGRAVAFQPDGSTVWVSNVTVFDPIGWYELDPPLENYLRALYVAESAVAVHDLEGDGAPEILVGMTVLDAQGGLVFADPTQGAEFGIIDGGGGMVMPVAADLDRDSVQEVLFGHVAYDASGIELWRIPGVTPGAHSLAADYDADGSVEVLLTSEEGMTLVSASGEVLWGPTRMGFGDPPRFRCWNHPAAVTDFEGDGILEALVNTCEHRMVVRIDGAGPVLLRSEPVPITTEIGAPTEGSVAFDFRGAGPDWVAYHHRELRVFPGMAETSLDDVQALFTRGDDLYPVVTDVDNDGSADVLTIEAHKRLVVYQDAEKRPSPARRIWNQWSYSPRAVREDGTIPPAVTGPSAVRTQARVACVSALPE